MSGGVDDEYGYDDDNGRSSVALVVGPMFVISGEQGSSEMVPRLPPTHTH